MVKVQLNLRVNHYILELLEHFKEVKRVSKTSLVETAIKEFCEKNKDDIVSEDAQAYLRYLQVEQARSNTKLEMRKATFIHNAKRKIRKMLKDGITQTTFYSLLVVWTKEAEANGIDKLDFLQAIQQELTKYEGGINEI